MKITFSNLGTIKRTELDLRPLTVIIGPNNSSKTYVAYSIYGLWQTITNYGFRHVPSGVLSQEPRASVPIDQKLVDIINRRVAAGADFFKHGLNTFFQDSNGIFSKTNYVCEVDIDDIVLAVTHLEQSGALKGLSVEKNIALIPALPITAENGTLLGFNHQFEISNFMSRLVETIFSLPVLLPAERNAFIITYKMLANRRYKLLKDAQREIFGSRNISTRQIDLLKEQGDIRYPRPIEDFLDFLTEIDLGEGAESKKSKKTTFQALANEVELHIQNKNKTTLKPTNFGGREIKIDIKKSLSIDLYNASSSTKQLAPLLLYLRYRAKPNDFLIIDEPEMNLHPESQAKLLEVLSILVNLGVRVLITTHSPYFMSHLNNLVAGDIEHPSILEAQARSLYLGDKRAFLPLDKVSAYEMRNNELCSLKDEDYGIRWDTLSDVAVDIQQRFFAISEKGDSGGGKSKK